MALPCDQIHTVQAQPGKRHCTNCGAMLLDQAKWTEGPSNPLATLPNPSSQLQAGHDFQKAHPTPAPTTILQDRVPQPSSPFDLHSVTNSISMLAILVSTTWKPEGEVFPIRGERTRVGRGPLEISLSHDRAMSDFHAIILIRLKGRRGFTLSDNASQNGTYLNGELIEEAVPLPNYARIRMGSTEFTFIVVDPDLRSPISPP